MWSRRGALFNERFPRIAEAVGALPVETALIDGEAVVFLSASTSWTLTRMRFPAR